MLPETRPNQNAGDEEQSYLVSVSDLMAGLLFLFIIALSVYALNFKVQERKAELKEVELQHEVNRLGNIVDQLLGSRERRKEMLRQIEEQARKSNIKVTVNEEQGVLHLPEGILFDSGSATLNPGGQTTLKVLAEIFHQVLPKYLCFPQESSKNSDCANKVGTIETVFIEGHTDRQPLRPGARFQDNLELSAARARNTFRFLAEISPELVELKNLEGQYIFSLSGYGEHRPIKPYEDVDNVPENRRIDFRFIMFPPQAEPEMIQELQESLKKQSDSPR